MVEAKKFELSYYGPINRSLLMMVNGVVTCRAYDKFSYFRQKFIYDLERSASSTFGFICVNRWVSIRLDMLVSVFCILTVALAVGLKDNEDFDKGDLIFSVLVMTDVIVMFSRSMSLLGEMKSMLSSSQNIIQFTQLPQEDMIEKMQDKRFGTLTQWPSEGRLQFKGVSLRYPGQMDLALKDINFELLPGEKVGVVGTKSAGKSSLLNALFRFNDIEAGRILIDGQDIRYMGLNLLRKSVTYIPFQPYLIFGTIRDNVDPSGNYDNSQVVNALRAVGIFD
jgi:ABC-type multidrug transport system fused ATPase/permease subunit